MAVPPYAAGAGLNQALQPTQSTYMAFIANNLWNFATPSKIRYDCSDGAAYFATTSRGGNFRLANFLGPSYVVVGLATFPWRCWRYCNCYDLAGIVALAFKALGNHANNLNLVLPPLWQFMKPFGYVTDGPLFGWPQYQNLNSPFWLSPWLEPNKPQHFNNPLDPNRTRFTNHAFTEVAFVLAPATQQVVDVCKAVLPAAGPPIVISNGSQDRGAYLAAAINQGFVTINNNVVYTS
ncbi:hypothetical protein GQ44DRAFT_262089 [Phaeosphaeriaceae sp. PMI808]|nr:hypothetical protein GQ44DRAFT_262089 [Phaeosphaeriaceae sp. PMI808]